MFRDLRKNNFNPMCHSAPPKAEVEFFRGLVVKSEERTSGTVEIEVKPKPPEDSRPTLRERYRERQEKQEKPEPKGFILDEF